MKITQEGVIVKIEATAIELRNLAHQMELVEKGAQVVVATPGQTHTATYHSWTGTFFVEFHTAKPHAPKKEG